MPHIIKSTFALALMGGVLAGVPMVDAHHAMVMYDSSKTLVLEGTVVELRWTNPHVFVRVEGRIEDGPATVWVLETSSPGNLVRLGNWSETALKPGDKIKVELNPHRDSVARSGGGEVGRQKKAEHGCDGRNVSAGKAPSTQR